MGYPMTQWMLGLKQQKLRSARDKTQREFDTLQQQQQADYQGNLSQWESDRTAALAQYQANEPNLMGLYGLYSGGQSQNTAAHNAWWQPIFQNYEDPQWQQEGYYPTVQGQYGGQNVELQMSDEARGIIDYRRWQKSRLDQGLPVTAADAEAAGLADKRLWSNDPSKRQHANVPAFSFRDAPNQPTALETPAKIGAYNTAMDKIRMLSPLLGAYGAGGASWNPNQNAGYDWMKYLEQFKR